MGIKRCKEISLYYKSKKENILSKLKTCKENCVDYQSIEGYWRTKSNDIVTIKRTGFVLFKSNYIREKKKRKPFPINYKNGKFSLGPIIEAELKDNQLIWNTGGIWTRLTKNIACPPPSGKGGNLIKFNISNDMDEDYSIYFVNEEGHWEKGEYDTIKINQTEKFSFYKNHTLASYKSNQQYLLFIKWHNCRS